MPEFLSPKWKGDTSVSAENWTKSQWNNWFWTGRWCFLVHAVCLSEQNMPNAFWEQQGTILNHIQENFAEFPEKNRNIMKVVNVSLGRVKSVLENLEGETPDKKQRKTLMLELGNLMEYLSPKETGG